MSQVFYNNVSGVLLGSHSDAVTTLTLVSGHNFPDPGADYYLATLAVVASGVETAWEIVRVTAVSGDDLTVTRAEESTTALAWADASPISLRLTAGTLNSLIAAMEAP